jgi:hypothetical protein
MKVIDLEEAKAHLEQYARECQSSPIVVTVAGAPAFEMLPIRPDDLDLVDLLLEQNEDFRHLMEERAKEAKRGEVSSLEAVRARLNQTPRD